MVNTQNQIVYAVNSDLDDGILYAEFATKEEAIDYAKKHLDKLPFVDELEVTYDANGEIEDVLSYKTIWAHNEEEATPETEDDYWDDLAAMYDEEQANKHDLGDTTWFESMNNLVETLEESEDTVECKECFDLFPKADCIKLDIGYVCPTCAECGVVSEDEIFKIDFPEYEKFSDGNAMVPEEPIIPEEPVEPTEEIPAADPENPENEINPISTPEEAVPFLVRDEEEAIAGYEKAAEVVAESDLENKEEILDTIEHIKEEEEEHIEELTELLEGEEEKVPEDPEDEDVKEDTEETPEEEVEEIEDPEAEPVEEAMSDFQRGLIEKLPKMTKEEFKTMLASGDTVKIFYGDPREPGVRSRDYEVTLVDGIYEVTYWEETYNDDFTDSELAEEFEDIDDLWDFMVNFMEDDDFSPEYNYVAEALTEHVNEEHAAIESDQELEGTDNAVVDCKVADVVTHSEDEKPVDCEGKKKPLEESLTEAKSDPFHDAIFEAIDYLTEFSDIFPVPENIGAANWEELKDDIRYGLSSDFEIAEIIMEYFNKDLAISKKHPEIFEDDPQSELTLETCEKLKRAYDRAVEEYKAANPEDFEEQLDLTHGYPHIKSVATLVHKAVENVTKDNRVGTRPDGMSFYVLSDKRSADPEKMKKVILDALAAEGYEPDEVQFVDKGQVYGYVVGKIKMMARATMSYQKKESLTEDADDAEFNPTSEDPAEKPSKSVKQANTEGTAGMDFEAACQKFGVELDN
jgi:hypothetical protein